MYSKVTDHKLYQFKKRTTKNGKLVYKCTYILKSDLSLYFFCNFPIQDAYSNFETYWKLRKRWLRGKKIYASLTDDEKMHLETYLPK